MAKKKATQPPQIEEKHSHQAAAAMEEKVKNLKSLNAMLLKETVEGRQQLESLQQANGSLDSELTHLKSELVSQFTRLSDCADMMAIERDLVCVFFVAQVGQQKMEIESRFGSLEGEMMGLVREKSEIERMKCDREFEIEVLEKRLGGLVVEIDNEKGVSNRVARERDEIRVELDCHIEEANVLKQKLIESDRREGLILQEVGELRVKYVGILGEMQEKERRIEMILRDKVSVERSLVESNRVIDEMKTEIEEMGREKEEAEVERNSLEAKSNELEIDVSSLNSIVVAMKKEEKKLCENVAVLEKKCYEGEEKEKQMLKEIGALGEAKNMLKESLASLIELKGLVEEDLEAALKKLDEQKSRVEEIVKEKSVVEEARDKGESEIFELQKQVAELKDTILSVEESSRAQMEKMKGLESEVSHVRGEFDRVTIERDEAKQVFNEEKTNRLKLREKIVEMEKSIEETQKVVGKMKDQNSKLIGQKKELESRCTILKDDLSLKENTLVEAQKAFDDMQAKAGLADSKLELILTMLKDTTTLVSQSKDESVFVDQMKVGDEIKEFKDEFEAIKNAFKTRESTVDDMKRQLEVLQHSEARHKKGFWTLLTSATTIFAAASVAYVTRGL